MPEANPTTDHPRTPNTSVAGVDNLCGDSESEKAHKDYLQGPKLHPDTNREHESRRYLEKSKQMFDSFDHDKNHKLELNEVKCAVNKLGYQISDYLVPFIMVKFDIKKKGCLEFDDFIRLCCVLENCSLYFQRSENGIIQISFEKFLEMGFSTF